MKSLFDRTTVFALTQAGEQRAIRIMSVAKEIGVDLKGGRNREAARAVLAHEDVMTDSAAHISMETKILGACVLVFMYEETVKRRSAKVGN